MSNVPDNSVTVEEIDGGLRSGRSCQCPSFDRLEPGDSAAI